MTIFKYKVSLFSILFLSFLSIHTFGQNIETEEALNSLFGEVYGKNIEISLGPTVSFYRDFATSPLFYTGGGVYFDSNYVLLRENSEFSSNFSFVTASYSDKYLENTSFGFFLNLDTSYIVRVNSNSLSDKIKFFAGGRFAVSTIFRINPAFGNNAFGNDIINNLFGTGKITLNIDRKEGKSFSLPFNLLEFYFPPRKRDLSFTLNIGIVNSSYRSDYIFTDPNNSILNNQNSNPWERYEYKVFSGFRMMSDLSYTLYYSNKNAMRFSYRWDAYKTGGEFDKLEVANHAFVYSLIYYIPNQ